VNDRAGAIKFKEFYEADWAAKDGAPPEFDPTLAQRQSRIARALRPIMNGRSPREVRVLDASCGGGFFVSFFNQLGVEVVGADISANAILRARRINPSTRFVAASAEAALPFASGSFDIVWFGETLAHLFNGHNALSEFNRVLKPGGHLILTTPYHGRLKNLAIALFSFSEHFYPDNYRIRFYDRRGLASSLKWAGFTPRQWSGIGRSWPFWKSFFVVAAKTDVPGPPPTRIEPGLQGEGL
jgi:SAM-dependent methyltransferase